MFSVNKDISQVYGSYIEPFVAEQLRSWHILQFHLP
jgi:hypothetical protein